MSYVRRTALDRSYRESGNKAAGGRAVATRCEGGNRIVVHFVVDRNPRLTIFKEVHDSHVGWTRT